MNILSEVKTLVRLECANYQNSGPVGIKSYCWMREKSNRGICIYFSGNNPRCQYFEECVLPLNADLKEDYLEQIQKGGIDGGQTEDRKPDLGEGDGEGAEDIEGKPAKLSEDRMPVGKFGGASVLPCPAFHGMDSKKPTKGQ